MGVKKNRQSGLAIKTRIRLKLQFKAKLKLRGNLCWLNSLCDWMKSLIY